MWGKVWREVMIDRYSELLMKPFFLFLPRVIIYVAESYHIKYDNWHINIFYVSTCVYSVSGHDPAYTARRCYWGKLGRSERGSHSLIKKRTSLNLKHTDIEIWFI
jgi:hypothetical protein